MSKILFIANLVPYPLDNGGKIFTNSIINSLSKENDIDLLCFYEKENIIQASSYLSNYVSSCDFIHMKVTTRENLLKMCFVAFFSLFTKTPFFINKFKNRKMSRIIKNKIKNSKYDYVFFNILSIYSYAKYIRKFDKNIKIVLYEQNCEALIYKRMLDETHSWFKKVFLKIETKKLFKFETESINNCDKLILLSEYDKNALKVNRKYEIIPIGVDSSKRIKKFTFDSNKLRLLFVGTMTWAPNNDGIIWFLKNVMPCLDENKFSLTIVGKNPSQQVLSLSSNYNNVKVLGYVEKIDELYDAADVLVVPLFVGSGQRVKILEAFSIGLPVISTSIGIEGINHMDGYNALIANDENQFVLCLNKAFDSSMLKELSKNGREVFEKEYSQEVICKKINCIFK